MNNWRTFEQVLGIKNKIKIKFSRDNKCIFAIMECVKPCKYKL